MCFLKEREKESWSFSLELFRISRLVVVEEGRREGMSRQYRLTDIQTQGERERERERERNASYLKVSIIKVRINLCKIIISILCNIKPKIRINEKYQ